MPPDNTPCAGPGTRGVVRAWSEDPLTARSRSVWTSGDFLPIARSFVAGAEEFIARLALRPGESVLDVACGTGNLAIPAARAGACVSGIDIAPNLIAQARHEARTAGCVVAFEVGDAEALPYVEDQFDTTVTMFGAMFAYRPERAAVELLRVTRRAAEWPWRTGRPMDSSARCCAPTPPCFPRRPDLFGAWRVVLEGS
jgi:SAM-dependent methyltransferase